MATNDIGILSVAASGLVIDPSGDLIPGITWPLQKQPFSQTRIQRAISGRELRAQDYPYPLWQFELTFAFLRDQSDTRAGPGLGNGYDELRPLLALFMAAAGAYGTFLFDDPTDDNRAGAALGTGDSSTTAFQLQAPYGAGPAFAAPVTAVNTVSAVYLNGVTQSPSSYACATGLNSTGVLTFNAPPPTGDAITADFSFYFRCRFTDDSYQFSYWNYQLWELKKLTFISVFP
jgi:uncharacterized protein (TIGR02217 family)